MSEKRLAEHLGVSARTVQRRRKDGMPFLSVGGSVRYRISDVEAWLRDAR